MDQATWTMIRETAARTARLESGVSALRAKLEEIESLAKQRPGTALKRLVNSFDDRLKQLEKGGK